MLSAVDTENVGPTLKSREKVDYAAGAGRDINRPQNTTHVGNPFGRPSQS
jgi:hypothetical protein